MAGRRVGLPSGLCHRAHAASRALVPLTASHLCCALPCRPLTAWRAGPGTRGAGSCCHPSTELLHVHGRGAASRGLWQLHWSGKWAASGHETPMLLEPACKMLVCLTSCILWRCLLFTKPSACWQLGCCNWYEIGTQVDKEWSVARPSPQFLNPPRDPQERKRRANLAQQRVALQSSVSRKRCKKSTPCPTIGASEWYSSRFQVQPKQMQGMNNCDGLNEMSSSQDRPRPKKKQ